MLENERANSEEKNFNENLKENLKERYLLFSHSDGGEYICTLLYWLMDPIHSVDQVVPS